MSENRLVRALEQARHNGKKCLMPYLTAGYPDLNTTIKLVKRFDAAGCQGIEIGFPFSDSIADGPVIQDSFYRALEAGIRVADVFAAIAKVRAEVSAALLAMVSMSIVRRKGVEAFVQRAAECGFDGLIVPDVPVDECDGLARVADAAGLCNVLMSAPTSSDDRRARIGRRSTGFVYVIAARGITGERERVADDLADKLARMRRLTAAPLIVGFGVTTADHVREICRCADGAIVGSAIIRRITASLAEGHRDDALVDAAGRYVDELMTGLQAPAP